MNINDLHLRELYRFAELGRMSASLLHEISNPLSAALINLEISEPTHPSIQKARHNIQILRRYVEAAKQQVRCGGHQTSFAIKPHIGQVKEVMLPIAKRSGVRLRFGSVPVSYKLHGDPVKFQQIITNLVINAIQSYDKTAIADKKVVSVNISSGNNELSIAVRDWGEGIGEADLTKIFDMFYTTKDMNGEGLGIGLALAKQYAKDFGGTITAASSDQNGTCFTVKLGVNHR